MAKHFGNTKKLWIFWAVMYVICAVCSFMPAQQGESRGVLLLVLGMSFFVPPALLIAYSVKKKRMKQLKYIRNVSIVSLVLTLIMIILNFMVTTAPELLGNLVYGILVFVSVPMICSQIWLVGIFGWACLLMACLNYLYADEFKNRHKRKHRR